MIIIKTKAEIDKIEKADKIVAYVLDELLPKQIKPGVTTKELDIVAEEYIRSQGGVPGFKGYGGFPATLCTSINEQVVHGIPSKTKVLKNGDIISVDVGVVINGYNGDAARTFAVGEISEEDKKLLEVTKKSLYIGIKAAKVGNRIGDIGHVIQEYAESKGYSVVRDYCGHGIGKSLHEDPQIPNYGKAGTGPRIEDGMVLAIEPMVNRGTHKVKVLKDKWTVITKDRKNSAHFEHSVAIIDGKAKILSEL